MNEKLKRFLDLQMYAEGGDGGEGTPADSGVATAQADGKEPKVVYGKADTTEDAQPGVATGKEEVQIDKGTKFKELIKGEYAEEYQNMVKEQLDKRLKGQTKLQQQLETVNPILQYLNMAYGTNDPQAILDALAQDNKLFEEAADREGMSVEQYKKMARTDLENVMLKQAEEERVKQEAAEELYSQWVQESEQVKAVYPNFDLEAEIGNPTFASLLTQPGIDVKTAYETVHLRDIMAGTAYEVADAVRKNTIDSIRSRGMRPLENGITEQPGVVRKDDVKKFTRQDRAKIAELAAQGVEIKL